MAVITLNVVVANIQVVVQTFNAVRVYRSTGSDVAGPYVQITTPSTLIPLVGNQSVYPYVDAAGAVDAWYKFSYLRTSDGLESSLSDPIRGAGDSALGILSAQGLRVGFLFGIDLTDRDKNPIPDEVLEFYIKASVSWLERKLGIAIRTRVVLDEAHDYYREDFQHYMHTQLYNQPVVSVQRIRLVLPGNRTLYEIPSDWISLDKDTGLVRVAAGLTRALQPTSSGLLPSLSTARNVPDVIRVDYTAGFDGDVPAEIVEVVGMMASFGPLLLAGDLIGAPNTSSSSIGIDGLSQSVSLTGGYGTRLQQYTTSINDRMDTLRNAYRGIGFEVA